MIGQCRHALVSWLWMVMMMVVQREWRWRWWSGGDGAANVEWGGAATRVLADTALAFDNTYGKFKY